MELPSEGILSLQADCSARIVQITLIAAPKIDTTISKQFQSFLIQDIDSNTGEAIKPLNNVVIKHD